MKKLINVIVFLLALLITTVWSMALVSAIGLLYIGWQSILMNLDIGWPFLLIVCVLSAIITTTIRTIRNKKKKDKTVLG
jgi:membrane protein implicated in regulation of membrane protease activity